MSEQGKKAGHYSLDTFRIYRYNEPNQFVDLKAIIHTWEIIESMDNGHLHGSAKVYDSVGLLDNFLGDGWLRGEEELFISYRDWYDEETIQHNMFVYSVSDVQRINDSNESMYSYTLHFVSKDKFVTEQTKVRRGFRNQLISENVQQIYDDFYTGNKELYIEDTSGEQTLIVPNYSPEQAMYFFARRAHSANNPSQTFRFFENRDRYVFATHEDLIFDAQGEEIQIYRRTYSGNDDTPEAQRLKMLSIIEIEYPLHINTMRDMSDGAYYRNLTELDILNRTVLFNEYRYLDEYDQHLLPDGQGRVRSKHSKEFVDQYMSYPNDSLVIKDYATPDQNGTAYGLRPNTFYPEVYNDKRVAHYHHQNELITIKTYGNNTVFAGSLIQLDLNTVNNVDGEKGKDELRSGIYMVESVRNVFYEENYYQIMSISKSGFKGRPERSSDYENERTTESVFTEGAR